MYTMEYCCCCFSHKIMSDSFAPSWTVVRQTSLSIVLFRWEYWSGLPFLPLGDLPDPGMEPTSPVSPALQADSLPYEPFRKPQFLLPPPHAKSWLVGKDSDAGRDWGQEEKGMTEDEMAGWHHWLDGRESEWTPGVRDGQGGLACCDSWGRKESDTT